MMKLFSKFFGAKPKVTATAPVVRKIVVRPARPARPFVAKGFSKASKQPVKQVVIRPLIRKVAPRPIVIATPVAPRPVIAPKPIAVKPVPAPAPKVIAPVVPVAPVKQGALKPIIYPYDIGSEAAGLLAKALGTKKVRENGTYVYQSGHLIINYGNRRQPSWANKSVKVLNNWNSIARSANKLSALEAFRENGVRTVEFTIDKKIAEGWTRDGLTVMCRTILNGHSGHGIVVATEPKQVVDAQLYSVYKKHFYEYRLIVMNGVVIDFMQKKRKSDWEEQTGEKVNSLIRNHDNGWIFARNEVEIPKAVIEESLKAVKALGLNFAGVDVIFNRHEGAAYVLECNTAMGLAEDGTTLKRLSDALNAVCNHEELKSIVK
jgi:hypothetical protein